MAEQSFDDGFVETISISSDDELQTEVAEVGSESSKLIKRPEIKAPVVGERPGDSLEDQPNALSRRICKKFLCPLCHHVGTRLARIRTHLRAKHAAVSQLRLERLVRRSVELSRHGTRITSKTKIRSLLGKYAKSKLHYKVAKRVLHGHMIQVIDRRKDMKKSLHNEVSTPIGSRSDALKPSRRGDTVVNLQNEGMVPSFVDVKFCRAASLYLSVHSDAHEPLTPHIIANAQKIHRFVDWGQKLTFNRSETEVVFSESLSQQFVSKLRGLMQPNSIRNHCIAMIDLANLALVDRRLEEIFPFRRRAKLYKVREFWFKMKKLSENEARKAQRLRIRSSGFQNAPIYEICRFLREIRENGSLQYSFEQMEKSVINSDHKPTGPFLESYKLVLCLLALYLAVQGQRKCAALSLTHDEILNASQAGGQWIVKIRNHKTANVMGAASVTLKNHQYEDFVRFIAIRRKFHMAGDSVIANPSGKNPQAIFLPLERYLGLQFSTPMAITFNCFRKTIETNVCLTEIGDVQGTRKTVGSYLCHSQPVTDLFYRFKTPEVALQESRAVEAVLAQLLVMEMVKRDRGQLLPQTATEPFPSRQDLTETLFREWEIDDVCLYCVTPQTYEVIQCFWRETHRQELLEHIAQLAINNGPRSSKRSQIMDILKNLPDIWGPEAKQLVSLCTTKGLNRGTQDRPPASD